MSVKKINEQNFQSEVLNNKGVALVDFYADWCGPCQMLSPVISEVAEDRKDVLVGKVNVDDCSSLAVEYGVMSIPCLVVFKNGKEQARSVGYVPKDEILSMLG